MTLIDTTKGVCSTSNAVVDADDTDADGVLKSPCPGCGKVVLTTVFPGSGAVRVVEVHAPKPPADVVAIEAARRRHDARALAGVLSRYDIAAGDIGGLSGLAWQLAASLAGVSEPDDLTVAAVAEALGGGS